MKKKAMIAFLIVGAISMIIMSTHYLYLEHSGILRNKEVASSLWYFIVFRAHVLFGLIAITSGPFQFVNRIRKGNYKLHRKFGYTYFLSVFMSSLAGFIVAPFAMGGWITSVGFTILAFVWFYITAKSLLAIRRQDFHNHTKWSYLSYALTFTAITQRTLLLIPLLTSVPFMPIYRLSAWLPWMLNLAIAISLLKRFSSIKKEKAFQ